MTETAGTCTVKQVLIPIKVTANHSPNSRSNKLIVGLNEWNATNSTYRHRVIFTLEKNSTLTKYPHETGKWAKLRLTAGSK